MLSAPDNAEDTAGVALARFSRRFTAMVRRNRDVFLLMWQAGMRESRTAPNADSLPRRLGRAIEAIVRRGIDRGEFTAQDLPTTVRLLAGAHLALIAPPAWLVQQTCSTSFVRTVTSRMPVLRAKKRTRNS